MISECCDECCECGKPIELHDYDDCGEFKFLFRHVLCDECGEKQRERERQQAKARWLEEVPAVALRIGIPENMRLSKPVFRDICAEIWRNRRSNLLITGETGSGKTTSICFCLMEILRARETTRIRYATFPELVAEWNAAKHEQRERKYLEALRGLDVLAVDEIRGRRRDSESANELFFQLVDGAASGWPMKLWIAGNIQRNSFREMFQDESPVVRRLNEGFRSWLCAGGNARRIEKLE